MAESKKRKLFVVGGKDRNIPPWIKAAFEVEQFDQDEGSRGRTPEPSVKPDAVVILKSWIGHKHYYDAKAVAERYGVPAIEAAGGFAAALQAAAIQDLDWFVKAIEQTKDNKEVKEAGVDVEEVVENIWRKTYEEEWARRNALEKRYGKDREKFDKAKARLESAERREAAAARVITEVREAAQQQRKLLEAAREEARRLAEETRLRSERISRALATHMLSLHSLIDRVTTGEEVLLQAAKLMSDTKTSLLKNLEELTASLEKVEQTSQIISKPEVTVETQKSASNNELSQ